MNNYREPENVRSYTWICKTLVLFLCALYHVVCETAIQPSSAAKTRGQIKETQQQNQRRLLEVSRQFMRRRVNMDMSLYNEMNINMYPLYLPRRTNLSNYSYMTIFDISDFANESDIPEEITDLYEHDVLMITGNYTKERKSPAEQLAIVKRLYKALRNHTISELVILNLSISEDEVNNNFEANAARSDPKNTQEKSLELIKLVNTSFQIVQWINIYFSCSNLKSLGIKTNKEEMLNIGDYFSISKVDLICIFYSPDPKIWMIRHAEIRLQIARDSIGKFELESVVPINMPTGMFKTVTDTIEIPYVVFKNTNFRKMEPKNVKRLFIINVPLRDFMGYIKDTSKNITQAIQLTKLEGIAIYVEPIDEKYRSELCQQDVIKILQWAAGFNRNIKDVEIAHLHIAYNCMIDLKDNTKKIRSITPVIKKIKVGSALLVLAPSS